MQMPKMPTKKHASHHVVRDLKKALLVALQAEEWDMAELLITAINHIRQLQSASK